MDALLEKYFSSESEYEYSITCALEDFPKKKMLRELTNALDEFESNLLTITIGLSRVLESSNSK